MLEKTPQTQMSHLSVQYGSSKSNELRIGCMFNTNTHTHTFINFIVITQYYTRQMQCKNRRTADWKPLHCLGCTATVIVVTLHPSSTGAPPCTTQCQRPQVNITISQIPHSDHCVTSVDIYLCHGTWAIDAVQEQVLPIENRSTALDALLQS